MRRALKVCPTQGCVELIARNERLCPACKKATRLDYDIRRPTAAARGYDAQWRKIRARVLANAGIPKSQWHLYDVDHTPPYDPTVEPDHLKYELVPILHAKHSKKTAKYDGGFGNFKKNSKGEGR